MNLLKSEWLLAARSDGQIESVAPWQISTDGGSRYVRLAFPRPEFNGAAIQFLIGLVQTAVVLELGALAKVLGSEDIDSIAENPLSPKELRSTLDPLVSAFELMGPGPRFLQDQTLLESTARSVPVERLLLEAPGDFNIDREMDRFVQKDSVPVMCQRCAAVALTSHQLNAVSVGAGYRVGLRGGGPLTTLLKDRESLWQTIWLNVVHREAWNGTQGIRPTPVPVDAAIFPWMGPTRTSEDGQKITKQSIHPLQVFWAMPRRIRLVTAGQAARCGVCGELSQVPVVSFARKNYGCNYEGEFLHPLSPHFSRKSGELVPQKADGTRVFWSDLLGYLFEDSEEKSKEDATGRVPALAVRQGIDSRYLTPSNRCLWTFGFGALKGKAKIRSYIDGSLPLIVADEIGDRERLENEVRKLVRAARRAERYLLIAIKKLLKRRPKDASKALALDDVKIQFWTTTESGFEATWTSIRSAIRDPNELMAIRQRWRTFLTRRSLEIFEDRAGLSTATRVDPRRIFQAEIDLEKQLQGRKLREVLDLPTTSRQPKETA